MSTPGLVHIESITPRSRRAVAASLDRAARIIVGSEKAKGVNYPWHRCPPDTLVALRAQLGDEYAPSTANAAIYAVRGALKKAWMLGVMTHEDMLRAHAAIPAVSGGSAPGKKPAKSRCSMMKSSG